jgi:hypothetical protein
MSKLDNTTTSRIESERTKVDFLALACRPLIRRAFIVSPCGKEPDAVLGSDGDELNLGHCLFRVRVRRTENAMN